MLNPNLNITWNDIDNVMSLDDVQELSIALDAWEDGQAELEAERDKD